MAKVESFITPSILSDDDGDVDGVLGVADVDDDEFV